MGQVYGIIPTGALMRFREFAWDEVATLPDGRGSVIGLE